MLNQHSLESPPGTVQYGLIGCLKELWIQLTAREGESDGEEGKQMELTLGCLKVGPGTNFGTLRKRQPGNSQDSNPIIPISLSHCSQSCLNPGGVHKLNWVLLFKECDLSMQLIENIPYTRAKACKNDVKPCSNPLTNEHHSAFGKHLVYWTRLFHETLQCIHRSEDCVKLRGTLMVSIFFFNLPHRPADMRGTWVPSAHLTEHQKQLSYSSETRDARTVLQMCLLCKERDRKRGVWGGSLEQL